MVNKKPTTTSTSAEERAKKTQENISMFPVAIMAGFSRPTSSTMGPPVTFFSQKAMLNDRLAANRLWSHSFHQQRHRQLNQIL